MGRIEPGQPAHRKSVPIAAGGRPDDDESRDHEKEIDAEVAQRDRDAGRSEGEIEISAFLGATIQEMVDGDRQRRRKTQQIQQSVPLLSAVA